MHLSAECGRINPSRPLQLRLIPLKCTVFFEVTAGPLRECKRVALNGLCEDSYSTMTFDSIIHHLYEAENAVDLLNYELLCLLSLQILRPLFSSVSKSSVFEKTTL